MSMRCRIKRDKEAAAVPHLLWRCRLWRYLVIFPFVAAAHSTFFVGSFLGLATSKSVVPSKVSEVKAHREQSRKPRRLASKPNSNAIVNNSTSETSLAKVDTPQIEDAAPPSSLRPARTSLYNENTAGGAIGGSTPFSQSKKWRPPLKITAQNLRRSKFLHIPKTAGTKIQSVLKNNSKFARRKLNCTAAHTPPQWLPEGYPLYNNVPIFTHMRHPYDRAISEYNFVCWANKVALRSMGLIAEDDDVGSCQRNATQLNVWLRWAALALSRREHANKFGLDCHYVPQYLYAEAADFVFCNLTSVKAFMRDRIGLNETRLGVLKDEIRGRSHSQLDDDTVAVLNQVYEKDFSYCGFEPVHRQR